MTTVTTPWGRTTVVEQVTIPQQIGERRGASVVQLLANEKGERLVRFAYATDGTPRRGPVTLRERDLRKLNALLARAPRLRAALTGQES
jgi:hypothetical protein